MERQLRGWSGRLQIDINSSNKADIWMRFPELRWGLLGNGDYDFSPGGLLIVKVQTQADAARALAMIMDTDECDEDEPEPLGLLRRLLPSALFGS